MIKQLIIGFLLISGFYYLYKYIKAGNGLELVSGLIIIGLSIVLYIVFKHARDEAYG